MLFLATLTPLIGTFALNFKSFEFFWFSIFGIIICGNLTAPKDPIKGWIAGFIGLLVAMVGADGRWAFPRFSFGSIEMSGGIALIPAMVGAFGFAEIIGVMRFPKMEVRQDADRPGHSRGLERSSMYWKTIIRSGIVGTIIGAIPGVGEDTAAWVSYDMAKRSSKEKEKFGKGSIEGRHGRGDGQQRLRARRDHPRAHARHPRLCSRGGPAGRHAHPRRAARAAHHASSSRPSSPRSWPWCSWPRSRCSSSACRFVRPLVKVLQVPRSKLMPIVFILCLVGSFAIQQRFFDIGVMIVFGILGYFMREMEYPMAPMVLGIVLGDILDKNLRRALVLCERQLRRVLQAPHLAGDHRADRPHRHQPHAVVPGRMGRRQDG